MTPDARPGPARWRDAAAVLGLLAAILLLARLARPLVRDLAFLWQIDADISIPIRTLLRFALAAVIVFCALDGWWRPAAAAAWSLVVAESAIWARGSVDDRPFFEGAWPWLLALIVAALLTWSDSARPGLAMIGGARAAMFGGAAALAALAPGVVVLLGDSGDGSGNVLWSIDERWVSAVAIITYVLLGLATAVALEGLPRPVLGRVLALLVPITALLGAVQLGLERAFSGAILTPPPLAGPAHLLAVTVVAPVLLLLGLGLVRRYADRPDFPEDRSG